MSIHVSSVVWRTALGGPSVKAVAMKLADCANDDGRDVYPSIATIARETEVSERTVQYAIRELIKLGVLVIEEDGGKGRRSTTRYRFDLEVLSQLHSETLKRWRDEDAAKGANSAPLQRQPRVQKTTAKGANSARKGAMAAPEPSLPVKETTTTDDSKPDPHRLWDQLTDAANGALYPLAVNLQVVSEPLGWIAGGADLSLDILPTVRTMAQRAKPQSIRSWGYFAGAVSEARDRRLRGLPEPNPQRQASPRKTHRDERNERARAFLRLSEEMVERAQRGRQ